MRTKTKRIISVLLVVVICLSFAACDKDGNDGEVKGDSKVWSVEQAIDEFGDIAEYSSAYVTAITIGDFSNTATTGSELTVGLYMLLKDGYPEFLIRLLEYGDHKAAYTSNSDISVKIKVDESIIEFHPVFNTPPNGDLMIYDSNDTLYAQLYNGKDIKCVVTIDNSKYNFTIPGANFKDICKNEGYVTKRMYFLETDKAVLYGKAKEFIENGDYTNAIEYLEFLDGYEDGKSLLFKAVCDAYYSGDDTSAWKQFFNVDTATPLTEDEIENIIVGQWRTREGDTYSIYSKTGEYKYIQNGNTDVEPNKWYTENGRLVIGYTYSTSEKTIYPFSDNVYVFRTHQSGYNDVYELFFRAEIKN